MINDHVGSSFGQSLRLVSVEKYNEKYEHLKSKYKHIVKVGRERNIFILQLGNVKEKIVNQTL